MPVYACESMAHTGAAHPGCFVKQLARQRTNTMHEFLDTLASEIGVLFTWYSREWKVSDSM